MDNGGKKVGRPWWRRSVFWRVAGLLVGGQVATGLVAVLLSGYFAINQSFNLVENTLQLRLEEVAREIEELATFDPDSNLVLPSVLRYDLEERFPDPIFVTDTDGTILENVFEEEAFDFGIAPLETDTFSLEQPVVVDVPYAAVQALLNEQIQIRIDRNPARWDETWAVVPLYNAFGEFIGGFLVSPLAESINREISGSRSALLRALWVVLGLSGLSALLLGALLTWRLVRPIQRMTRRVEEIGAGDYETRVGFSGDDELGRLADAINHMAVEIQTNIDSMKAADALRRELVTNVGHDLRTPLAAVTAYLEEAERFAAAGRTGDAEDAVHSAQVQAVYLQRLVKDLFELSVLEGEHPGLRIETVLPSELIHEAVKRHRSAYSGDRIELITCLADGLPTIQADGLRVLRLLDNLLSNARRHTPEGGKVEIEGEIEGPDLVITVRDNGEGIDAEHLGSVFQRYYKGDGARTREMDAGTGLGLAISKAIAEAHGGTLAVESQRGQGSTFTLRIPTGEALL